MTEVTLRCPLKSHPGMRAGQGGGRAMRVLFFLSVAARTALTGPYLVKVWLKGAGRRLARFRVSLGLKSPLPTPSQDPDRLSLQGPLLFLILASHTR